ncbi:MAG: hypothetical protein ABIA74_00115 [bacterium]
MATFALIWVYNLVKEKTPLFIFYFIVPFSVVIFFISSFSNYVVTSFAVLEPFGYTGNKGVLFPIYSLYIGLLIVACLYKLARKSIQETDIFKKKQILSVFIGSSIFGLLAFVVNFFLPLFFDNFKLASLVSITYSPLLLFIIYSTVKHQFFGVKIMMTQFLVILFLSLLLLNFVISNSFEQYIWNGTMLVISMFLSYLIIKSMFKEIEFDKKLLEETKKDLDFEQRLRKTFAEISEERIKRIETAVFGKDIDKKL